MINRKTLFFKKYAFVFIMVLIVSLSLVFPFKIHILEAIGNTIVTDFGIKINTWRIVFEPVFGPLLYLNRMLYTLSEIIIVFGWVLVFFILKSVWHIYRTSRTKINNQGDSNSISLKKSIVGFLVKIPYVIGLLFCVFIVLLFIPLPNNTIENNSKDKVLVTTHAHTEFSHDGLISQEGMFNWHKRNGFDAFFITDHKNHLESLDFAKKQRNGVISNEPLIMVGQEFSGSNHMSLLGLQGKFNTRGFTDEMAIDSTHKYGGVVIMNHWFDGKGEAKELYKKLGADGFEIENTGKDLFYDLDIKKDIKEFCQKQSLVMVGGADFMVMEESVLFGMLLRFLNGKVYLLQKRKGQL